MNKVISLNKEYADRLIIPERINIKYNKEKNILELVSGADGYKDNKSWLEIKIRYGFDLNLEWEDKFWLKIEKILNSYNMSTNIAWKNKLEILTPLRLVPVIGFKTISYLEFYELIKKEKNLLEYVKYKYEEEKQENLEKIQSSLYLDFTKFFNLNEIN